MVWVVWLRRAMGRHCRFENFRIGPSLSNRIKSERPIRIQIESWSFAGPYIYDNIHGSYLPAADEKMPAPSYSLVVQVFEWHQVLRQCCCCWQVETSTDWDSTAQLQVNQQHGCHAVGQTEMQPSGVWKVRPMKSESLADGCLSNNYTTATYNHYLIIWNYTCAKCSFILNQIEYY